MIVGMTAMCYYLERGAASVCHYDNYYPALLAFTKMWSTLEHHLFFSPLHCSHRHALAKRCLFYIVDREMF